MEINKKAVRFAAFCFIFLLTLIFIAWENEAFASEYRFNMSYVYFGDPGSHISLVDNTKKSLNEIAPSYFDLNEDGSLKLTNKVDVAFINEMHKRGIKVVPFLSNHWNRELGRQAIINRQVLARQIADAVREYNLDGVNVDIENLTEENRDDYTDLIRLLRELLPREKTLSVAVAPNPFWSTKGWQGSYDYRSIAEYADYIMVMAYDEHYQGGQAGPVASSSFVENSIKYALENVPAEKVVLGIPFYGRYWMDGASYGGYGVSLADVHRLIKKYRGKVLFDHTAMSPKAIITIKSSDVKPYVYGRKLNAGTYTIWYENEESIKHKLKLVEKYNLRGTGSWSLGQEEKNTWDYYKLWLNGYYFSDVQGHWAQDQILSMAVKGWMRGVSNIRFLPESPLTRAEAAVILVRAFELAGKVEETAFKDIRGHWAEREINLAAREKIVLGRGKGLFGPDDPVTRQELAVMLDRVFTQLEPLEGENINYYRDISPLKNSWSYDAIVRLTQYGIFTGRPDGGFYPADPVLRAEMAALMDRAAKYILEN
jgi:spore germination protein YaaH